MGRVKFKHPRGGEITVRHKLLGILAGQVQVFRLFPANDGVVVITNNDGDVDAIFRSDIQEKLEKEGFTALMPPELKSQRSVICFGLDDIAYDHSPQEIRAELEAQQDWLKISEIYKFQKTNTIKITCASSAIAKKATENGILMFYLSIPPSQLRVEDYVPLTACDRCHAVEKHTTSQCNVPASSKICSECGSRDHTFRNCSANEKFCVNCKTPGHSARAMRCPVRKQAVKDKQAQRREAKTTRPTVTYATATLQSPPPPSAAFPGVHTTPMVCLVNAHLRNAVKPGTFQVAFSSELARNGIPDVQLDPDQPSLEIVKLLSGLSMAPGTTSNVAPTAAPEPEPVTLTQALNTQPVSITVPHISLSGNADGSPSTALHTPEDLAHSEEEEEDEDVGEEEEITMDSDDFQFAIFVRKGDTIPAPLTYPVLSEGLNKSRWKLSHNGTDKCSEKLHLLLKENESLNKYCKTPSDTVYNGLPTDGPWPPGFDVHYDPQPVRQTRNRKR